MHAYTTCLGGVLKTFDYKTPGNAQVYDLTLGVKRYCTISGVLGYTHPFTGEHYHIILHQCVHVHDSSTNCFDQFNSVHTEWQLITVSKYTATILTRLNIQLLLLISMKKVTLSFFICGVSSCMIVESISPREYENSTRNMKFMHVLG